VLLALILVGVALLMPVVARFRDRVPGVPRELEEPPDEAHPAELAYLWSAAHGRRHPSDAYRAQLLHLVQENALSLEPVGRPTDPDDFTVGLNPTRLDDPDAGFVRFLFTGDSDNRVSLKEATEDRGRGPLLAAWLMSLRLRTMTALDRMEGTAGLLGLIRWATNLSGVFRGSPLRLGARWWRPEMILATAFAFSAAVIGQLALEGTERLIAYATAAAGWGAAALLMPRRLHPALRERVARWRAFRRYLSRTSLEDAPAGAVVLWERHLVWAVALGLGDQVERQVAGRIPPSMLSLLWTWTPSGWGWITALPVQDLARYVQGSMPSLGGIRWPGARG
jgi:hypothetical protein